ncbi:MAG TPA: type II toxin-antitoxin system prevent-host-death family antitoxin [Syntrophobacteraceae bacterium]|nr:type II toxin-antitoxin system prevent-host-death family antitoxin [Syntrophobacteraceae bacterium]
MGEQSVNVAEAKKHLSELLGRVAFGKEQILITKRGKPMAKLVPAEEQTKHLADAEGWLEKGDDFFRTMEHIVENRSQHLPRVMIQATEE